MERWQRSLVPQIATATILGGGAIVVWLAISIAVTVALSVAMPRLPEWELSTIVTLILLSPALLAATPFFDRRGPNTDPVLFLVQNYSTSFVILGIVSLILALLCYVHHRRYDPRTAFVWAVYVLLMGVPGAIGYWLHRRWPPTERCSRCGLDARCDLAECAHCGAIFPSPGVKGNEIFDTT